MWSKPMAQTMLKEQPLDELVAAFLTNLAHANRSPHTRHAYATDLAQLCAFYPGPVQAITVEVLRNFFGMHLHLSPATRARKQAAVARFLTWAHQHELLDSNPMLKIERVKLDPPQPRGIERDQIERILKAIPAECRRDRLFFRLLLENGLRVSEGLSLYVEDLDLSLDNEHLTVVGKGGKGERSCSTIHVWCSSSEPTSNAGATSTGPCSERKRTDEEDHCVTSRCRNDGTTTARRQASPARCTNFGIRMRLN